MTGVQTCALPILFFSGQDPQGPSQRRCGADKMDNERKNKEVVTMLCLIGAYGPKKSTYIHNKQHFFEDNSVDIWKA